LNTTQIAYFQTDFYAFYLHMSNNIDSTNWWERDFCNFCEECYASFLKDERPIWYIEAPVQHGKTLKLKYFLGWLVGRHRNLRFNYYSGDDKLRKETSAFMQNLFREEKYLEIFGDVVREKGTENIDTLELKDNGQIDFRMLSSGQVGYPSNISIIDDPYSKSEQASSEVQKESIIARYRAGVITRRQSKSMVLITHSRWFIDDLIGRVKDDIKNKLYINISVKGFSYPAIAIENEKYRKVGDALFPELRDKKFLEEQKKFLSEAEFEALYQQNPIIEGGNLFKLDWFIFTDYINKKFDYRFITADTASKDKEQNDFTVFSYFGVFKENNQTKLFLIDMRRAKIEAVDIERWIENWIKEKITYGFRNIWIEDKGHGIFLNQSFRRKGFPIPTEDMIKNTLPRDRDKVLRANNILPAIDKLNKNVYINSRIECLEDFKNELLTFPNGKHDDTIDTLIDGVKIALFKKNISIFDVL
jgi:predicted phage terminase large subunit-like protein